MSRPALLLALCWFTCAALPAAVPALPEGGDGLAANYPGDTGIAADPAVIFADDFESYASASGLSSRWDSSYHHVRIATNAAEVFHGGKSLELSVPQQSAELSNAVTKLLSTKRDLLFLRFYSKFDTSFDVVGSSHNGCSVSANYYINGNATPGVPADGTNKFLVNYEHWRGDTGTANPGLINLYIYHPEQRSQWGDHFFPTGIVMPFTSQPYDFGPDFVPRPDIVPEPGRWYCYELMVKANTPGVRDGRISCWLDGQLVADFPNLRLRDIQSLKLDRFSLDLHIKSNTAGATRKWYDNVVAASSYIGPLDSGRNTAPVIVSGPSVSQDPVTGTTATLSVSASDADGDSLSYAWQATATPTGANPVTGSGQNPTVTFDRAGGYTFQVTVTDGCGGSAQDTVSVTVEQTADGLEVTP